LPIVLKPILNKQAKASEGDSLRMSEDTLSHYNIHKLITYIIYFDQAKKRLSGLHSLEIKEKYV
jgi:hypothetical protein